MNKVKFFNSAVADNVLTMTIYDTIGADFFSEGITAKTVSEAITNAGKFSSITLRINSPGGSAFDGTSIFNVLRASGKTIDVIVDGMAASAASIICMSGDTITMAQGSVMMIHEAAGFCCGNAAAMAKMSDTLGIVSGSIADIYASRTGTPKKEILEMMAVETWMDPKQALKANFCTAVSKEKAIANSFDLTAFKNAPAGVIFTEATPILAEVTEPVAAVVVEDVLIPILKKKIELLKRS